MPELWDIYDENRNRTGKLAERGKTELKKGEFHIVVTGIIMNSKNEILISQRAPHKKHPLEWECNGGSILAGESSLEGVIRELKEELGIEFLKEEAILLKTVKREQFKIPDFKDLWLFKKDIDVKEIKFPDGEAIAAKWVDIDKFLDMYNSGEIIQTVNFGIEEYQKALEILK